MPFSSSWCFCRYNSFKNIVDALWILLGFILLDKSYTHGCAGEREAVFYTGLLLSVRGQHPYFLEAFLFASVALPGLCGFVLFCFVSEQLKRLWVAHRALCMDTSLGGASVSLDTFLLFTWPYATVLLNFLSLNNQDSFYSSLTFPSLDTSSWKRPWGLLLACLTLSESFQLPSAATFQSHAHTLGYDSSMPIAIARICIIYVFTVAG